MKGEKRKSEDPDSFPSPPDRKAFITDAGNQNRDVVAGKALQLIHDCLEVFARFGFNSAQIILQAFDGRRHIGLEPTFSFNAD